MTTLFDGRLNEFQGSLDQLNNGSFTDPRTFVSTLNALNGEVFLELNGKAVTTFYIATAAFNGALIFEGSVDGSNYFPLPAFATVDSTGGLVVRAESIQSTLVITSSHAGIYIVECSGLRRIRCRVSAFTSGSVSVTARSTAADFSVYARQIPALLNQSIAPAVNTGGTLTLTGAAGLYVYVTNFQCNVSMNPATAQTGAAPVFVTTTGLSNNPAWSMPIVGNATASTGGANAFFEVANVSWAAPMKSTTLGGNVTFVIPAPGAACTVRANVQYYLGI